MFDGPAAWNVFPPADAGSCSYIYSYFYSRGFTPDYQAYAPPGLTINIRFSSVEPSLERAGGVYSNSLESMLGLNTS